MSAAEKLKTKNKSGAESAGLDSARLGMVVKARPPWPGEFTGKLTNGPGGYGAAKIEPILMQGAQGQDREQENQKLMTQIQM